jgi:nicotinic acid mononucleotide adenylyltransferase
METPDNHLMTATLLPLLHTAYPDHSFVFLLGSDTAVHSLPRWTRLELLRPYRFVVGMRTTETPEAVRAVFQQLHFNGTIIQSPLPNLSSSSIRQLTKY